MGALSARLAAADGGTARARPGRGAARRGIGYRAPGPQPPKGGQAVGVTVGVGVMTVLPATPFPAMPIPVAPVAPTLLPVTPVPGAPVAPTPFPVTPVPGAPAPATPFAVMPLPVALVPALL